jgi:hypothetical protein
VDFSCFGYHPYLESRLTIQGKWVLAGRSLAFSQSGEREARSGMPPAKRGS